MAGATSVADLGFQPTQAVVDQLDGFEAGRAGLGAARIIATEEQYQGSGQLFSSPPGPLAFKGVPVAIVDGQKPLQGYGLIK